MSDQKPQDLAAEIGRLIAQRRRIIWLAAAKRLQEEGESMLTFQVLGQCKRNGPTTQRTLADALAQHPAGISRVIDDMEQRKLVKRARDPRDRRRVNVAITARGEAYHEQFLPYVVEVVQTAITPLSSPERRTLRDLLRKLVNASAAPRS
jgi:DNA-binding MarR family transcriptional regulator